jgi:hypothetical protein
MFSKLEISLNGKISGSASTNSWNQLLFPLVLPPEDRSLKFFHHLLYMLSSGVSTLLTFLGTSSKNKFTQLQDMYLHDESRAPVMCINMFRFQAIFYSLLTL